MLTHTTLLISKMDPIKYIFEKPALSGRIARWQMILTEYDIQYTSQKAINGSVVCHTPKFSLLFLKTSHTSILKDSPRVDQTNSLPDNQPKLGFGIPQIQMDFQLLQWVSCFLICFRDSPCQVSSFTSQVSSDNCSD